MNGSSKLSLAVALALLGGNAFALGLGNIQLNSKLDQPLSAEIPVLSATAAEVNVLKVGLASAEDFQRVGLSRARVSVPLEFSVGTDSSGQPVIKVTTKDIVREPFLDFLVEVNWPKGKVLREYTVLLDPPVMAPALRGSSASVSPAHEVAPARPQQLAEEHHAKPKPIAAKPTRPVAQAKPATPAKEHHAATAHTASAGQYGPVAQGETLSEIARATRDDESTNLDKVMLAMLKANPNAFYKDNINALKRGAILRIPSADEIKATGSALEAAAQVREQSQAWSSNTPVSKPTLVATTGAPKKSSSEKHATPTSTTSSSNNAHLALVPPHAGRDSQATADRPGAASGSANAATTAQLARTKEALASRDQEVGDLKSRVKELEDLRGKDQRLLSLKQSELAQLQEKLKQINETKPATPAVAATEHATALTEPKKPEATTTKPVATTATTTSPKLTEKDIWGDIGSSAKTTPAKPTGAADTTTVTPAKPGSETAVVTPLSGETPATTTPATPATTTPAITDTSASATTTPNPASSTTPETTPKPAAQTTPVTPKPVVKPEPIAPTGVPWYQNENVLMGGGIALIIIGLLALMRFMRRPKPQPVLAGVDGHDADMEGFGSVHDEEEEHQLLDQLAQHPGDPQLSLELLSLYYAHNDADKFEAAAEAMYAHIADPHQAEWQQVLVMGKQLCPHNPLFDEHADLAGFDHMAHADGDYGDADHLDAGLHGHGDGHEDHLGTFDNVAKADEDEGFDFDLTDHTATSEPAHEPEPATPAYVEELDLPDLSEHPTPPPPAHVDTQTTQTMAVPAEDFFAGEDAIGTKLDLAKAYLDMGDPEGARSMLDEVMTEGNDTQKDEARKLLAEIH